MHSEPTSGTITAEPAPSPRRAALARAAATLEARDQLTAAHSDDVVTLCEAVGRRVGFAGEQLERLLAAAQVHDLGKVAIPPEILNKPGPLSREEWAVVREHTVIGERMLSAVPEISDIAKIVRHAHEHYDGSGYPDGLRGEDIPLASRVVLCGDAFHAMRSDRPYRPGRPAGEALTELRANAGRQFDPHVVGALTGVARDLRTDPRAAPAGMAAPRSRRLAALLVTLTLGGGTAMAASSDVRDAIRSVVGAAAPPPVAPDATTPGDLSFGPLGDRLSLQPVRVRIARDGATSAKEYVAPLALVGGPGAVSTLPSAPLFASPQPGAPDAGAPTGPALGIPPVGPEAQTLVPAGAEEPAAPAEGTSPPGDSAPPATDPPPAESDPSPQAAQPQRGKPTVPNDRGPEARREPEARPGPEARPQPREHPEPSEPPGRTEQPKPVEVPKPVRVPEPVALPDRGGGPREAPAGQRVTPPESARGPGRAD